MPISVEQLRAARGLLGWSQSELAVRQACHCLRSSGWREDLAPTSQMKREKNCSWRSKRLGYYHL